MDVLESLLDGPRARGAFLLRSVMDPPWSLRIRDESPLTVVAMVRGWAWLLPDEGAPHRLAAGDVAVVRGPDHYTMADDPATAPTVVISPGQVCTRVSDGAHLAEEWDLGVRTWGADPDGATVMLTGTYEHAGEISRPLLSALPGVITLTAADWDTPLVSLLAEEIVRDHPGQRAVLDRLLDVLLITALRTWFGKQRDRAPAWYRAQGDPVVGKALQLLQNAPAHPWTVAKLAAEAGVSRAALARRFTELIGEPPMSYLTNWRLALAADLLCQPDVTIGAVARQVGYSTAFALSAAFKRERGISPQQHRQLATG
ncbi:MAG TPA: AraC family transcriptional regulator [Actinophytocola sp.]|uniref:AraC family transcriptional regulator n=1 Tax=Actinophytocola sp. TaxID=1872138 RepID=UPI002DDDB3AB|nr:AraC family transcriptional regulator [Actinophytocola sp.]HEV2779424.1 AraC family transcriptional regulator [Actinophytocola sp.]